MKRYVVLVLCASALTGLLAAAEPALVTPQLEKPAKQAQNGDPLHEKYEAAWSRYEKAIGEVRDRVNAALDAEFEKAADAGNLELADLWDKKKKFYADTGGVAWASDGKAKIEWRKNHSEVEFPEAFTETLNAAKAGLDSAVANLRKDYDSLVRDYTKERKLTEAKDLRTEFESLLSRKSTHASSPSGGQQGLDQKRFIERSDTYVLAVEMSASGVVTLRTGKPADRSKVAGVTRKQLPGRSWECDYVFADPQAINALSTQGSITFNPKTALLEMVGGEGKQRLATCNLKARVSAPFSVEIEHLAVPPDTGFGINVSGMASFTIQLLHKAGEGGRPLVNIVTSPWNVELSKPDLPKTIHEEEWSAEKPWRYRFQMPMPKGETQLSYNIGLASSGLSPAATVKRPVSLARFSVKGRMTPLFGLQLQSEGGLISVRRVLPELPALKGGVRDGDVLLSINGKAPANVVEAVRMLGDVTFEEECLLLIQRGDEQKNIVMKASWD